MTVKELIHLLIECDMDREVKIESYGEIEEIEYDEFWKEYRIKIKD